MSSAVSVTRASAERPASAARPAAATGPAAATRPAEASAGPYPAGADHPATVRDEPDPALPRHKHLKARSTWRGRGRTDIDVRDFQVATGEPEKVGGDDSAPTPMEVILAGLEGCLTVVIETLAAERGHALSSVSIDSHAVMDVRGFEGLPGVRPYYETVDTTVELALDIAPAQLPSFGRAAEDRCPALTLLRAAEVDATVKWVLI